MIASINPGMLVPYHSPRRGLRIALGVVLGVGVCARPGHAQGTSLQRFTVGGRDIVALDFAGTAIGDFPTALEMVDGVMDVVDVRGTRMLRASAPSTFLVRLPQVLPQDFTLEFEFMPKACCNPADLQVEGTATANNGSGSAELRWHPGNIMVVGGGPSMYQGRIPDALSATLPGQLTQVVLVMQGATMKLYTNGRLLFQLPNRQFERGRVLRVQLGGQDDGPHAVYLARLRVVDNAPPVGPVAGTTSPAAPNAGASPTAPNPPQPSAGVNAPTRLTWSVRVNNHPLQTTEVQALGGAAPKSPRDYLILIDELAAAMASTAPDAQLQLRGQTLTSVFGVGPRPPTPGPGGKTPLTGGANDSLDNFVLPRSQVSISIAPLTLQAAGVLSQSVRVINGRAYVPLSDVAAALGGSVAIRAGGIDISGSSSCGTCLARPP